MGYGKVLALIAAFNFLHITLSQHLQSFLLFLFNVTKLLTNPNVPIVCMFVRRYLLLVLRRHKLLIISTEYPDHDANTIPGPNVPVIAKNCCTRCFLWG